MNIDIVKARLERRSVPEPNTGCQLWVGATHDFGYGHVAVGGHKVMLAHRASFTVHVGEIPRGLFVLHKCDTPACINPEHLFLGGPGENARDMSRKGRGNFNRATKAQRSEWAKRAAITMGPEERHERAVRISARLTPEQRRARRVRSSENGRRLLEAGAGIHAIPMEERLQWMRVAIAASAAMSREKKVARAQKAAATRRTRTYEPRSPEKERERVEKMRATKLAVYPDPSVLTEKARSLAAAMSPEKKRARALKAAATRLATPEIERERVRKYVETRRANKAARAAQSSGKDK